jgi:Skp family chaperone for outer membrane proteins
MKRGIYHIVAATLIISTMRVFAVEIPLETLTPVRIGFVDLQKVFDTYPEKAFAEGDLLKEVQKRRSELAARQNAINVMRSQIAADQAALDQAKTGRPTTVPKDDVSALQPAAAVAPPPPPQVSTSTQVDRSTASVEPYPTEEPLAGLPGHDAGSAVSTQNPALPGMKPAETKTGASPLLDQLAESGNASVLNAEAQAALQKRIDATKLTLDREVYKFKDYRGKAVDDMKQLQTQKTYGVMARIYAVLQGLARDENITVVLDKAYVLYGEESIDLTERLVNRLNTEQQQQL